MQDIEDPGRPFWIRAIVKTDDNLVVLAVSLMADGQVTWKFFVCFYKLTGRINLKLPGTFRTRVFDGKEILQFQLSYTVGIKIADSLQCSWLKFNGSLRMALQMAGSFRSQLINSNTAYIKFTRRFQ